MHLEKRFFDLRKPAFHVLFLRVMLGLFFCLVCGGVSSLSWSAPAASQTLTALSGMEQSLYSTRYDKESANERLDRLETTIYGEPTTNLPVEQRVAKLQAVLSNQAQSTSPPPASNAANPPQAPEASDYQSQPAPTERAADESDYPALTTIENKLFGKTFASEDITKRLTRLETKVYGHTQSGALIDRVDALRLSVLGDTGASEVASSAPYMPAPPGYPNYAPPAPFPTYNPGYNPNQPTPYSPPGGDVFSSPNYQSPDANGSAPPSYYPAQDLQQQQPYTSSAPSADMLAAIAQVEKQVLRKSYPMEPVPARLSRLEMKVFHQAAPPGTPDEDRLQRIIAVAAADGGGTTSSGAGSAIKAILPVLIMLIPLLL